MPYTRFKIGWVDVETHREKRAFILILSYYLIAWLFGIYAICYTEPWTIEGAALIIGAASYYFLTYKEVEWLDEEYSSRMDPTKDLEDYE